MAEDGMERQISLDAAENAFLIESQALQKMGTDMDKKAFAEAVRVLKNAGKTAAAGCGHSGIACEHFAHLMCCIEKPSRFLSPSEALHGGLGYLSKGDVLVLASRGGKTEELYGMLTAAKKKEVFILTITENRSSPLALGADLVLPMKVTRETDKYNRQGTTSFIVLCAIFDALQASLIEETGYLDEQFRTIHPGGAVGEQFREHDGNTELQDVCGSAGDKQ